VIESYDAKSQKIKGKIVDWVFELKATNEFAKQQAANNRVFNRIKEKTTQSSPTAALKFDASDLDYGDEIPFHHER